MNNKRELSAKLTPYDTSDILEQLAEEAEKTSKELLKEKDGQSIYYNEVIRRQRNLVFRLRLLACEFLDIGD